MNKSYVLFDLDGTVTDPGEGITNSLMYALDRSGIGYGSREELYAFIGPPLLTTFSERFGMDGSDALRALGYYREYFSDRGIFENKLYDGIPRLLGRLREKGMSPVLATSKPDVFAEKILRHFGIYEYFLFVAGNTLKEERPEKRQVIRFALDSCGILPGEALMVGDRRYDVEGAASEGLPCVGVSYGYGSEKELSDAGAVYVARSVGELEEYLLAL